MDMASLGKRLASARDSAGMTQEALAQTVGLDRSAISRLEKGERKLSVPELVTITQALRVNLAHLVEDPVPAIISRRRDSENTHGTTAQLDDALTGFATDLRFLLEMGLIPPKERPDGLSAPRDHDDAERIAQKVRDTLDLGHDPLIDLGRAAESLGLFTSVAPLGESSPDGACVEVAASGGVLGAAVVNADTGSGRRRMTLAHELGHWLFGDAYDAGATSDTEQMIQSFAIHLLAPRPGVLLLWHSSPGTGMRERAINIAASYRLSWSAAVSQLRNLDLISHVDRAALLRQLPRRGDFDRLGLDLHEDLHSGYLSPGFRAATLSGYTSGRLTEARALELMRGTLSPSDLPSPASTDEGTRTLHPAGRTDRQRPHTTPKGAVPSHHRR